MAMKKSTKQLLLIGGLGVGGYFAYKWYAKQARDKADAEQAAYYPSGYGAGGGYAGGLGGGFGALWGGGTCGPANEGVAEEPGAEGQEAAVTHVAQQEARVAVLFGEAPTGMGASRLGQLFAPGATVAAPRETGYGPTMNIPYGGSVSALPASLRPAPAPVVGWPTPRRITEIVKGYAAPAETGYGMTAQVPYAGPSPAKQAATEAAFVREAAAKSRIARTEANIANSAAYDPRTTMAYQATQAAKATTAGQAAAKAINKLAPSATKNALLASLSGGPAYPSGTPAVLTPSRVGGVPPADIIMSRIRGMA